MTEEALCEQTNDPCQEELYVESWLQYQRRLDKRVMR